MNENLINEAVETAGENLPVVEPKTNLTKKVVIGVGITAALAGLGFGVYKLVKHFKNKKAEPVAEVTE